MSKNTWIAIGVSIVVVLFFFAGSTIIGLFQPSAPAGSSALTTTMPTDTTGLIITDEVVGTGTEAVAGDLLTVNYVGTLADGTKFDSSIDRGQPFQFVLGTGQVIQGWEKGFAGMKVGGVRTLVIPPSLGYGDQQVGPIPPNSTLTFEVSLLNVQAPPARGDSAQ